MSRHPAGPAPSARRFTFDGSGGDQLAARLDLPTGEPVAVAVFAHCFTCSQDTIAAARIARGLVEAGVGVLRFDFTGLGSSAGEFANTNFSSNVEDLRRASEALGGEFAGPVILIGHSLGGTAVLAAAAGLPRVAAVVTVNAPADPAHVLRLFPADALSALAGDAAEVAVELGGRRFRVRRQFLTDLSGANVEAAVRSLRRPLLVLHAPTDQLVDVANARRIFDAARHPKSFVSLDGADHLLTGASDGAYVADIVAAWVSRYLPAPALTQVTQRDGPPEGEVLVRGATGRLEQRIEAGRHSFLSDEPQGIGDDTGPTPYDLLLASLGACTSMTLQMYAGRKGWPLEGASVRLRHSRRHGDDCRDCESRPGMIDLIERDIELAGPLTADQRARLVDIAARCPVHRTLLGEKRIVTRLVEESVGTS
ncbi:MAG: alpha/beta fold hydrolase [Acidimicrobiales bacterium]